MAGLSFCTTSADTKKLLYKTGSTWGIVDTRGAQAKQGERMATCLS